MIKIKPIKNCDGYFIESNGDVYSNKKGYLVKLNPYIDSKGNYLSIKLITNNKRRKGFLIHRLVAEHFIDNPMNLPEVNHKDNNKRNNNVDNLEWCTRKYNLEQSYKTMSPKRNCKQCLLYVDDVMIGEFESIVDASIYGQQKYGLNRYSLEKNLQCGNSKIILLNNNNRKNVSDNKIHKQYKK